MQMFYQSHVKMHWANIELRTLLCYTYLNAINQSIRALPFVPSDLSASYTTYGDIKVQTTGTAV